MTAPFAFLERVYDAFSIRVCTRTLPFFSHANTCTMKSHFGLYLHFPKNRDVEPLESACLPSKSLFKVKSLFKDFFPFLMDLFLLLLLLLNCENLYDFDGYMTCKYFIQSLQYV